VGFLAVAVALAIVDVLSGLVPMSIYVLTVATMIGLGVGIDYSLLLLRRFREELERGVAVNEAVARTVATAGATVGTSGLCVVVGVAVAAALTLLPALLALLGTRVLPRNSREARIAALRPTSELATRRLPVNGRGFAGSAVAPSCGLSRDRAAALWERWARAL